MIYFLRCEQDSASMKAGWIKIGTTTRLSLRLKQIAAEIGHTPTVLAVIDGAYAEEHALHIRFKEARVTGEWFYPRDGIFRIIETEGRPWDGRDETFSVKIHKDVIETAYVVAAIENISMTDLLSDILRPILAKKEEEGLVKRSKARGKGGPKP